MKLVNVVITAAKALPAGATVVLRLYKRSLLDANLYVNTKKLHPLVKQVRVSSHGHPGATKSYVRFYLVDSKDCVSTFFDTLKDGTVFYTFTKVPSDKESLAKEILDAYCKKMIQVAKKEDYLWASPTSAKGKKRAIEEAAEAAKVAKEKAKNKKREPALKLMKESYKKVNDYAKLENLCIGINAMISGWDPDSFESDIDGLPVMCYTGKGGIITGVWYTKARMGTFNKNSIVKNEMDYAENDPYYPYSDEFDDGY